MTVVFTATLLALKMRHTGIMLSVFDILTGLMIMGIGGTTRVFTPFKLPFHIINIIGIIILIKGVYCLVLSRR
jgi:uncharacterized membrane protein YdcZ (DUF606 family)